MTDRLTTYLLEVDDRAFDWREWNCAHFTSGWVQRCRGFDPGFDFTGRFADRRAFAAVIRDVGHRSFVDAVAATAARNGIAETGALRRGDIAIVKAGRRPVLAIALGGAVFAVNSAAGLSIGRGEVLKGWSIA